ncbi:MAG: hypothetical protein ACXWBN_01815 [Acidimicrobiales bacterium]
MLSKPRSGVWPVLLFTVWTLFVWLNRISNALSDDALSSGGKAFSVVLSLSVVVLAVAAGVVGVRGWSRSWSPAETSVLRVAAAWAGGLWLVLVPKILIDGRPAGFDGNLAAFKAVHVVLGLISMALAVLVWRATARAGAVDESRHSVSAG